MSNLIDNRPALEKHCDKNPIALAKLEKAWVSAKRRKWPLSVELWWEWADNHGPMDEMGLQEFILLSSMIQIQTNGDVC